MNLRSWPRALVGCEVTHVPVRLAAMERLVAVNSALEVDLFGQCNLEYAEGRPVSGCGGAPDMIRLRTANEELDLARLLATPARRMVKVKSPQPAASDMRLTRRWG